MALIQCPVCEKEISKRAYFCPHCGRLTKFGHPVFVILRVACVFIAVAAAKYLVFG